MDHRNIVLPNVTLADTVEIGVNNVLGIKRKRLNVKCERDPDEDTRPPRSVSIGARAVIRNAVIVYEGVEIGADTYLDDNVKVGAGTKIGDGTMLLYGVQVLERVTIGRNCRIAGFIPDDVVIEDDVTMMGTIAHKYQRPLDWSRTEESPHIEAGAVVGLGTVLVGPITIGANSYVGAGATVTKNVPRDSIVFNTNEVMTFAEFRQSRTRSAGR